jgi:hypothetical protein
LQGNRGKIALRLTVAAVVAAVATLAALGAASAHKPRFASTISIHAHYDQGAVNPYFYSGRVRSEKDGCVSHRTVELKNESTPLGDAYTDSTDAGGRWRIALPIDTLDGDYFAKVKRREKRHYVCKGARSEAVPAPLPN